MGTMVYWAPEMYEARPKWRICEGLESVWNAWQFPIFFQCKCRGQEIWLEGGCVGTRNMPALYGPSPASWKLFSYWKPCTVMDIKVLQVRYQVGYGKIGLLGCSSKVNNAFPFVDEQEVRTKSIDLHGINRPCLLAEGTPFPIAFFKTT